MICSKGLFFGGNRLEQGLRSYRNFLADKLTSAERIQVIDVHTGLGKKGEDVLLVERSKLEPMRDLFGHRVTSLTPAGGTAYQVRGGHDSLFSQVFPNARIEFVVQEFGTYSATRVLHALREENRLHHYGKAGIGHPAKEAFKEAFCPKDEAWRSSVLHRGQELLMQASELAFR